MPSETPSSNSPKVTPETALPSQRLPDKTHEPLLDPFDERRLVVAEGPTVSMQPLVSEHPNIVNKPYEPTEEEIVAQVDRMKRDEAARRSLVGASEPAWGNRGLTDDLSRTSFLRTERIPESHKGVSTVEARIGTPPGGNDFNQFVRDRRAILDRYSVNDLVDLANAGATRAEIDAVVQAEREVQVIATEALNRVDLANVMSRNVGRDLNDLGYRGELAGLVRSLEGLIDINQMQALYYSIESARRQANGQPTEGFSWEPAPPDILGLPEAPPEARSDFLRALHAHNYYRNFDTSRLTDPAQVARLTAERNRREAEVENLIDQAEASHVMEYVIEDYIPMFNRVQTSRYRAREPQTPDPIEEAVAMASRVETDYQQEGFWTLDGHIGGLRDRFGGIGTYLAPGMAEAMVTNIREGPLALGNTREDNLFRDMKAERKRRREQRTIQERKVYGTYRERYEFTDAEDMGELTVTVFDWLAQYGTKVHLTPVTEINTLSQRWKENGKSALDIALVRLGVTEHDPRAIRLQEALQAYVDVISAVKAQEFPDGVESWLHHISEFSLEFGPHHDAIRLFNPRAVITDRGLSANNGEIYRAGDLVTIKPLSGDTKEYRSPKEMKILEHAIDHELYITEEEFERARLGEREARAYVAALNPPPRDIEEAVRRRVGDLAEEEQRTGEGRNARYCWGSDDPIEERLLIDSEGQRRAGADPNRLAAVDTRTAIFKGIKDELDREDGLYGLSEVDRRIRLRTKIKTQMDSEGHQAERAIIDAMPPGAQQDRALWEWVRERNEYWEGLSHGVLPFYPSKWDQVRLAIDRPSKLVDRQLSEEEVAAMEEPVIDQYRKMSRHQIEHQLEVANHALPPQDRLTDRQLERKLKDVLFAQRQRAEEASRAFSITHQYHKFTGLEAKWGGMVAKRVDKDGKIELITINVETEEILKAKIDAESREIDKKMAIYEREYRTLHGRDPSDEAVEAQRGTAITKTAFAATHALRRVGLAWDMPAVLYSGYNDTEIIKIFSVMAGLTDGQKAELHQLIDRGRREWRAVIDHQVKKYMNGQILSVQDNPDLKGFDGVPELAIIHSKDKNGKDVRKSPAHREDWDTPRVVNEGGVSTVRDVLEAQYMISKSGGVKMPQWIGEMAYLGVVDLPGTYHSKDMIQFHGFMKRRHEVELAQQSLWNIKQWKDAVAWPKAVKAARAARTHFVGGSVEGKGKIAGLANEPFDGAYKIRKIFMDASIWLDETIKSEMAMDTTERSLDKAVGWFQKKTPGVEVEPPRMEEYLSRLLKRLDAGELGDLSVPAIDSSIDTLIPVTGPLRGYMDALKDVVANRAGEAPLNHKLGNELIFKPFVEEALTRIPLIDPEDGKIKPFGDETMGAYHLGYAIQLRTPIGMRIFESILRQSTYELLDPGDRKLLTIEANIVKKGVDDARQRIVDDIARNPRQDLNRMLRGREAELIALNTSQENRDKEAQRIKDWYIDDELYRTYTHVVDSKGEEHWGLSAASYVPPDFTVKTKPTSTRPKTNLMF